MKLVIHVELQAVLEYRVNAGSSNLTTKISDSRPFSPPEQVVREFDGIVQSGYVLLNFGQNTREILI